MAVDVRERRAVSSGRRWILLGITLAAALAALALDATLSGLVPNQGGLDLVLRFFGRALTPALDYESEVPEGTPSILLSALAAMRRTLVFAVAAMSLAVVGGVILGFAGSSAWWSGNRAGGTTAFGRIFHRVLAPSVWFSARVLIVGMRSVHELLWAVLFLAAMGLNNVAAVIAIAIPYTGTLAKVFSEMIDEAPRDAAFALRGAGASNVQVFGLGLVPRALPDMCAYAFYRFECAIRSSAILGFFGFPTLGYSISASFENFNYGEVWTYLYALSALVIGVELWSSALRRRFVA